MALGGALEPHVPAGALTEVNLASVERPGEAQPFTGLGRFAQ